MVVELVSCLLTNTCLACSTADTSGMAGSDELLYWHPHPLPTCSRPAQAL
jgi:hypothetical protein